MSSSTDPTISHYPSPSHVLHPSPGLSLVSSNAQVTTLQPTGSPMAARSPWCSAWSPPCSQCPVHCGWVGCMGLAPWAVFRVRDFGWHHSRVLIWIRELALKESHHSPGSSPDTYDPTSHCGRCPTLFIECHGQGDGGDDVDGKVTVVSVFILNMAVNCSEILSKRSWMVVELPTKVAVMVRSLGGCLRQPSSRCWESTRRSRWSSCSARWASAHPPSSWTSSLGTQRQLWGTCRAWGCREVEWFLGPHMSMSMVPHMSITIMSPFHNIMEGNGI